MNSRYLADPLQQLSHAYKSYMRRAILEAGIGLPITHVRVLKSIAAGERCTAQALAACMRRDKAQITRVLNDLLATGLIVKRDNPADRRSQLLELSSAGQGLMQQIQRCEAAAASRMTRGLDSTQVDHFIHLANHMADNLNDHQE